MQLAFYTYYYATFKVIFGLITDILTLFAD